MKILALAAMADLLLGGILACRRGMARGVSRVAGLRVASLRDGRRLARGVHFARRALARHALARRKSCGRVAAKELLSEWR
jgi:hypothetical protein